MGAAIAGSTDIGDGVVGKDMIPNPMFAQTYARRYDDRLSDELRTYLRFEWSGDPSALRPRVEPSRPRRWARSRRFLKGRVASQDSGSSSAPPARSAPADRAESLQGTPVTDCEHARTEYLGASGFTEFLRCLVCGDLFLLQPGHVWQLRPKVAGSAGSGAP